MAVSESYRTFVLEQLRRVIPDVRAMSMFGGAGIYAGQTIFALISDDALYFKVDATTRPKFEARGLGPFRPMGDTSATMSYYLVAEELLEDPEELRPWVEDAISVARRSKTKPPRRTGGRKS